MLVVVKDGNIEFFFQAVFDFKTARRGNVFEIDAAERGRNVFDRFDNFMRVFRRQTNRKSVNAAEFFEQLAFSFLTGIAAAGPISPKPNTAVPSEITATVFFLSSKCKLSGSL